MCAWGVTAALYAREKTGKGQVVDTALMGSIIAMLGFILAAPAILGQEFPRDGDQLLLPGAERAAYVDRFARSLPNGYATRIDDDGGALTLRAGATAPPFLLRSPNPHPAVPVGGGRRAPRRQASSLPLQGGFKGERLGDEGGVTRHPIPAFAL